MKHIQRWFEHFERNGRNRLEPEWTAPLELSGTPLILLRRSIQQFQLGDGGGPAYLIAWNRADYLRDAQVKALVDRWFKEEREHSRLLGGMLRRLGGDEIKGHWSFSLFCGLRKILGVQFELHALLCTEIVSHVYYKMLRKHGRDVALRQMCDLIIRDETGHIAFHRSRLVEEAPAQGPRVRHAFGKAWAMTFRLRAVCAGTVLWVNHRGALRAFGATDSEFYRWIWRDVSAFIRMLRRATCAKDDPNDMMTPAPEGEPPQNRWKMGRVVLQRETAHRGGKTVTVIKEFAPHLPLSVIEAIGKRVRSACGCGGTVKDRRIEIQGDQAGRIRAVLEAEGFEVAGVR